MHRFIPHTISLSLFLALIVPSLARAQIDFYWFDQFFLSFDVIVQLFIIPILMSAAVLLFMWGVVKYFIIGSKEPAERETARAYMVYGILGLVLIIAVWGILALILAILGIGGTNTAPSLPGLP